MRLGIASAQCVDTIPRIRCDAEVHTSAMKSNTAIPVRKPAHVSLDAELLERAQHLKIDISKASEEGLARAVAQRQASIWLEANGAALQSSNEFVDRHGLPLASYRLF